MTVSLFKGDRKALLVRKMALVCEIVIAPYRSAVYSTVLPILLKELKMTFSALP